MNKKDKNFLKTRVLKNTGEKCDKKGRKQRVANQCAEDMCKILARRIHKTTDATIYLEQRELLCIIQNGTSGVSQGIAVYNKQGERLRDM